MNEITFNNIKIEKDDNLKIFRLFKLIDKEDGVKIKSSIPFGAFKNIEKIKRIIYSVSDTVDIEEKEIVKITKVNNKKDIDRVVEFDLDNTEYITLGNSIKLGNKQDELLEKYYYDFFLYIKDNKYLPIKNEKQTNSYGIFGDDYVLLPNKDYVLSDDSNINSEILSFENNLLKEFKEEELKEVATKFKEYLAKSKLSQIIFAYSLVSPFRYYLLDKGLKEFGFLGVRGESGFGKTTRIKILCNLFHSNYNYEGYDEEDVRTPFRFNNLQKIPSPMVIDDPENVFNILKSLLKTLGTSKIRVTRRGRPDQKMNIYLTYRPIVFSYNFTNFKDSALFKRIINIDTITNNEIKFYEKQVSEDEINYLIDNVHKLGNYFYENIDDFLQLIKSLNYDKSRARSKETILFIGYSLMLNLFKKLNINTDELVFDYTDFVDDDNSSFDEKETFKRELISQIKKLTEANILVGKGYRRYNIFHLLDKTLLDDDNISKEVIEVSASNGIYLVSDGILLHDKVLNHINLRELNIKKITDLKQFFNKDEFYIINPRQESGFKSRRPLKLENNNPVTGFLVKKNVEYDESVDNTNELSLTELERLKSSLLKKLEEIDKAIDNKRNEIFSNPEEIDIGDL